MLRQGREGPVNDPSEWADFLFGERSIDMKITREHVDKALNEIERRVDAEIRFYSSKEWKEAEIVSSIRDKVDGMNATFMMIADNWPEVAAWIDRGMEERSTFQFLFQ